MNNLRKLNYNIKYNDEVIIIKVIIVRIKYFQLTKIIQMKQLDVCILCINTIKQYLKVFKNVFLFQKLSKL